MKARIVDSQVYIYSEPDQNSPTVTVAYAGAEVALGSVKTKEGNQWVKVRTDRGEEGYMQGTAKVFIIRPVTLLQDKATVYSSPSLGSLPKKDLKRNEKFSLVEVVKDQQNQDWVRVRDRAGEEGFIQANVKVKKIPVNSKQVGRRNMLVGGLWFIGGVVVTLGTLSAATSGGTYVVAWGAIVFGGIQFMQGLFQVLTSSD